MIWNRLRPDITGPHPASPRGRGAGRKSQGHKTLASNPFSTRFVRPGAIRYCFPAGTSAQSLVERLRAQGWRGEIIGPHGSGKSTLLATLLPELERAGAKPFVVRLTAAEPRLSRELWQIGPESGKLLVVDGYEQLGWLRRTQLKRLCRRRGWGLLITAHHASGLPELFRVIPDVQTMLQLVSQLVPAGCTLIDRDDVVRSFDERGGNARETLFQLYDLYEQRLAARSTASSDVLSEVPGSL